VRCGDQAIAGIDAASALVGGDSFRCVTQRGRVTCWSYLDHRLHHAPSEVPNLDGVTDLAASKEYACAVHGGGSVSCWHFADDGSPLAAVVVLAGGALDVELGHGYQGQLAHSRNLHGPPPGGEYGCAIMADRTVTCWGTNLVGELGDGSLLESASPIGVAL
jgi:alpha-tubulin suppressor-like RCC1 family protein